jgi:hypothetical protein
MFKWFHHLFNPHCPDCARERAEEKHCANCDVLREIIAAESYEKKQLLDKLINPVVKEVEKEKEVDYKELKPRVSWAVKREMLEAEDRKRAELLRDHAKATHQSTEELEQELGIKHG